MNLPSKITIKHYPALKFLSKNEKKLDYKVIQRFLILFYGVDSKREIEGGDADSVMELFNKTTTILEDHLKDVHTKPSSSLSFGGVDFELVNMLKPTIGWMIDATMVNESSPAFMVCALGYIPKGSYYGETDQNENMKYPASDYREIFEEEFLLSDYIRLNAFFLTQFEKLVYRFKGKLWAIKQMERMKMLIRGRLKKRQKK